MALCKMCHKVIPDGRDYCDDCEQKIKNQADESYLDSLLNSVSVNNVHPAAGGEAADILSKARSQADQADNLSKTENASTEADSEVDDLLSGLLNEIDSGLQANEKAASEQLEPDDISDIFAAQDAAVNMVSGDFVPADDLTSDAAEQSGSAIPASDSNAPIDDLIPIDDPLPTEDITPVDITDPTDGIAPVDITAPADDITPIDITASADDITHVDITAPTDDVTPIDITTPTDDVTPIDITAPTDDIAPIDITEPAGDSSSVDDISPIDDIAPMDSNSSDPAAVSDIISPAEDITTTDDIPSDLFSDISEIAEPGGSPDIGTIDIADISGGAGDTAAPETADDLLKSDGTPASDSTEDSDALNSLLSDITASPDIVDISMGVDDLFSEAPGISSDISDASIDSTDINKIMDDIENGSLDKELASLGAAEESKAASKPKKSLFQRLFGNVIEERTPEEEKAYQEKLAKEAEEKVQKAEAKKQKAAQSKEEKAAAAAQAKADKAEKAKAAAELKEQKKKEAAALAQKRKEEKAAKAAAEAQIDEGHINKVGATILFVLMALILAAIVVVANIYTYKISINNAQTDFSRKKYNEAYYDVYGLQIEDEDIELYDRIMTVMYVNSQLNAYNNYTRIGEDEKALDSLLKGLQKYDKYYQLATILDIEDDLTYVKDIILTELYNKFGLTEDDAYDIIALSEPVDYSEYLYALLGDYEVSE